MKHFKFERGIIHLGIIGLVVLAAGLFAASKLASNPDLTFFNIAKEAKGIGREECRGCFGDKLRTWDFKKLVCIEKKSQDCKLKLSKCLGGRVCGKKQIPGSSGYGCLNENNETVYCCQPEYIIDGGRCRKPSKLPRCSNPANCSRNNLQGPATFCDLDGSGRNNLWCCQKGYKLQGLRCVF